jgi:hypothetical protein
VDLCCAVSRFWWCLSACPCFWLQTPDWGRLYSLWSTSRASLHFKYGWLVDAECGIWN